MSSCVRVEVIARVADADPQDDAIYLTGNLPTLGRWKPDGVALERIGRDEFHGEFDAPRGHEVEFKFTRGSWDSVEKDASGADIPNRRHHAESSALIMASVDRWGYDRRDMPASTLKTHKSFPSSHLGNKRTLRVYLPPGYQRNRAQRYPVLYMHDGQNLFNPATAFNGVTWRVRETADELIRSGQIEPLIIVGIDNTPDRLVEYTPSFDPLVNDGGRAHRYLRFITDEVKPFINERYRTRTDARCTAIAGSSLGGLISLFACFEYPEHFSKCGALSPSLWWNDHDLADRLGSSTAWLRGKRLWFDMGTAEASTVSAAKGHSLHCTRELAEFLEASGMAFDIDYRYEEVVGGEHNEQSWGDRFDRVLTFLFGRRAD